MKKMIPYLLLTLCFGFSAFAQEEDEMDSLLQTQVAYLEENLSWVKEQMEEDTTLSWKNYIRLVDLERKILQELTLEKATLCDDLTEAAQVVLAHTQYLKSRILWVQNLLPSQRHKQTNLIALRDLERELKQELLLYKCALQLANNTSDEPLSIDWKNFPLYINPMLKLLLNKSDRQ